MTKSNGQQCRVESLLREVASIDRAMGNLDGAIRSAYPRQRCNVTPRGVSPVLQQRRTALERLAQTLTAESEVGAVWQMLLARSATCIDDMIDEAVSRMPEGVQDTYRDKILGRMDIIQNNLFAAAHVLVAKLDDPDLNLVWKRHWSADNQKIEDRPGAVASKVVEIRSAA